MKKITFLILITTLASCQKKEMTQNSNNDMDVNLIKKHLKLQERIELSENDTDLSHVYSLTDVDIELGGQVIAKGLKNNGNSFLEYSEFQEKIKEIFEENRDASHSKKIEHKNFIVYLINPNNEQNIEKTEFDYTYDHLFVFPKYRVFSDLPLLGDIVTVEGENISITIDDKIKYRNQFLFNNNRAAFTWLLFNDKEFLKNLLMVFGYDREDKINEIVLNDLFKSYESEIPISTEKLGKIFFVKDCTEKLKIREGLLKYVSDHTNKDDDRFIHALGNYLTYMFNEDVDSIFDEDLRQKFTLEEKVKIVAYVANIESPAFYKYKWIERPSSLEPQKAWNNAGTFLYNITAAHPEILKIIEKNNYYGLKALKEVIEGEDFEEEKPKKTPEDFSYSTESGVQYQNTLTTFFLIYDRPDFSSFSKEVLAKGNVEIVHQSLGWNFVKVNDMTGYLPTDEKREELQKEEKKKFSFLAEEEDMTPEKKKKGFWDNLFG
jgi:hypothetical protein